MFFYYVNMYQVNKSFLKFATDFGPLAIFFFYYYNSDKNLSVAIPPLIVATLIALIVVWFLEKKNTNDAFDKWYLNLTFWWSYNLF